ncbi:MAG: hypothetical protein HZB10_02715 [Candidatus Yonathbacteria bacterium]|nr:hypothetical protein [Candidatus Yonathbacteria bacterium]
MIWKLILVGLGLVTGDLLMKNWIIGGASFKNWSLAIYLLALVFYGGSLTAYAYQLRTMNFGIATIVPILVNVVVVALISFFYYKEALSLYQSIGILLAVVAVILFSK